MSETTNIEWATSTGNPWIGCTKVSPGCANCYAAELDANRFSRTMGGGTKEKPVSHWGKGAPRFRTKGFWKDAVRWNRELVGPCDECGHQFKQLTGVQKLCAPNIGDECPRCATGHYSRPRIFPSLCDWLDDEVPIEWLADFLKLIHDTPNLDWLLLTKRPENFAERIGQLEFDLWDEENPPHNVWIGTSVEDQQRADERIPEMLRIPAKVRFLSVEPLLGPVDLNVSRNPKSGEEVSEDDDRDGPPLGGTPGIDWVIVGGESGPGARPCNIEWIRSIVEQCKAAGVSCFVKQLGSAPVCDSLPDSGWDGEIIESSPDIENYKPAPLRLAPKHKKGGDPAEWPEDLRVRQFPTAAGK